jgi:hypothetical protein
MKPAHMTHDDTNDVWGWEDFVAQTRWDDVENWWNENYFSEDRNPTALKALLDRLEAIVPKIDVKNGMERLQRHLRVSDESEVWQGHEHLRGAAAILDAGELAAAIEGTPPTASKAWAAHRTMVEQKLALFLAREESTKGAEELSRQVHAQEALDSLRTIDRLERWMWSELDDEVDKAWLSEVIAQAAFLAFDAGRRTQAAWGKEFERYAVAKLASQVAFGSSNEGRDLYNEDRKANSIARKEHAKLVSEALCGHRKTAAERAGCVLRNWTKIGDQSKAPRPPSKKTLQNWLSKGAVK